MADEERVVVVDPQSSGAPENGGGAAPEGGASAPAPVDPTTAALTSKVNQLANMLGSVVKDTQTERAKREQARVTTDLDAAIAKADREVEAAKAQLTKVQDEGTASEIADAHAALSQAIATRTTRSTQVEAAKEQMKREAERPATAEKPAQSDEALKAWMGRNPWYNNDAPMTAAAKAAHTQLANEGKFVVGSRAYWTEIDNQMRQKFPDRFAGAPAAVSPTGGDPSTTSAAPGQVRVQRSVVDGWRKMGLDVDNPEVLQRLAVTNRQAAVDKGILGPTPVTARIRT